MSNREGGFGRFDMLIQEPEKGDARAIVMEVKVAQEALGQLENRLYHRAVASHVKYLTECGIAFGGKRFM